MLLEVAPAFIPSVVLHVIITYLLVCPFYSCLAVRHMLIFLSKCLVLMATYAISSYDIVSTFSFIVRFKFLITFRESEVLSADED